MKPVQHEHTIEVKIPTAMQEKTNAVRDYLTENKKPYLFGIGGVVLGVVGARVFSRPSVKVEVVINKDTLS